MKRTLLVFASLVALGLSLSACSINHYVHEDYPQYLSNNTGASKLPRSAEQCSYAIDPKTAQHRYEFRSALVGYANLWIVEFGKILDQTVQSKDVQEAFGRLEKQNSRKAGNDSLLVFDLVNYTFNDFGAHVELKVTKKKSDVEQFSKTYQADGRTQGGKMFWGGVFAMKNAIHQSTKLALDDVFRMLIADINGTTKTADIGMQRTAQTAGSR